MTNQNYERDKLRIQIPSLSSRQFWLRLLYHNSAFILSLYLAILHLNHKFELYHNSILQFCIYILQFCVYILQFCVYILQFWIFITNLSLYLAIQNLNHKFELYHNSTLQFCIYILQFCSFITNLSFYLTILHLYFTIMTIFSELWWKKSEFWDKNSDFSRNSAFSAWVYMNLLKKVWVVRYFFPRWKQASIYGNLSEMWTIYQWLLEQNKRKSNLPHSLDLVILYTTRCMLLQRKQILIILLVFGTGFQLVQASLCELLVY